MREPLMNYKGEDLYLVMANYVDNGRLYLGLENEERENYCDITINLSDIPEIGDMVVFLNGDISNELKKELRNIGLISNPIQRMPYNYGLYDIVIVNKEALKDYDKDEYNKFEEYYKKKHRFKRNKYAPRPNKKKDKKDKDIER